jgi:hypothetical protein
MLRRRDERAMANSNPSSGRQGVFFSPNHSVMVMPDGKSQSWNRNIQEWQQQIPRVIRGDKDTTA